MALVHSQCVGGMDGNRERETAAAMIHPFSLWKVWAMGFCTITFSLLQKSCALSLSLQLKRVDNAELCYMANTLCGSVCTDCLNPL